MAASPDYVQVQAKLELGHTASCRKKLTPEGFTHDWKVFVRGSDHNDISHFVEKVIFNLHESFPNPKRAFTAPPYEVKECGYGTFSFPIDIYFRNKEEPKKVTIQYDLILPALGCSPITNIRSEALKFLNPPDEFKQKVLKAGGEVLDHRNGIG
ncbi:predicted protein [Nematostella vectensis]|uniref:YEATS domain-containing protein n=2 Tax=Nematostella vectensis TaxID=45351 RepID=A7RSI6_NEMVE|nr:predicted protein [Nematostella vectensis]|eukprot:XP_001637634.1 predicted protein [Nematostella vectensis]